MSFKKQKPKVELEEQKTLMIAYLRLMVKREDWHACWDACIDLQRICDKLEREKND